MSGVKGRSGPQKKLGTQIDEAMKALDTSLPVLVAKLIEKAAGGDRDALIYLIDRKMGRPHQSQDLRITAVSLFSGDDYEIAMRKVLEVDRKLIEQYGGNNAIQREGEGQAMAQDENEGTEGTFEAKE